MPSLLSRGVGHICENPSTLFVFIIFNIAVIAYVFLPLDFIPDDLGIIGFLDDFILIFMLILWICESFMSSYRNLIRNQQDEIRSR